MTRRATVPPGPPPEPPLAAILVANAGILALPAVFAVLNSVAPDAYYQAVQEDEALEWATFWSFAFAAGMWGVYAWREWRDAERLPWFSFGVALFCAFVALEEISWGQRLLGYRPPDYFLERNYQQEFNLHNVVGTDLRRLALKAVLLGYGVLLPLAFRIPPLGRLGARLAVTPPPAALAPAFLAAFALYHVYPMRFSGEIVEAMMGLSFLLAAWLAPRPGAPGERARPGPPRRLLGGTLVAFALVGALGWASAEAARLERAASPEAVAAARTELEALRYDIAARWRARGPLSRCGMHKRLFTWVRKQRDSFLHRGRFSELVAQGLPESRAEFLLDPWNSPYWVRHVCDDSGRERLVIYSFGPNRKRDSTPEELLGDDLGVVLAVPSRPR